MGIRTVENVAQFRKTTLLELMAAGIFVKDERTQIILTPYAGEDYTDSEASEASEASDGRAPMTWAVVYDVPPLCTEEVVLQFLRQTMDAVAVSQVFWTPGDPALAAWKIMGPRVEAMDGLLLTDATGDTRMTLLGIRKFAARKREYQEMQAGNRAERSRPPTQRKQTTYVDMARRPTSLLGPQYGQKGKGRGKGKGM